MIREPWLTYGIIILSLLVGGYVIFVLVCMVRDMWKEGIFRVIWDVFHDWIFWLRLGVNLVGYSLIGYIVWKYPVFIGIYVFLIIGMFLICLRWKKVKAFLRVWWTIHINIFPVAVLWPLVFIPMAGKNKHPKLPINRVSSR